MAVAIDRTRNLVVKPGGVRLIDSTVESRIRPTEKPSPWATVRAAIKLSAQAKSSPTKTLRMVLDARLQECSYRKSMQQESSLVSAGNSASASAASTPAGQRYTY